MLSASACVRWGPCEASSSGCGDSVVNAHKALGIAGGHLHEELSIVTLRRLDFEVAPLGGCGRLGPGGVGFSGGKVLWASLLASRLTLGVAGCAPVMPAAPAADSAGRSDVRIGSAFSANVTWVLRSGP